MESKLKMTLYIGLHCRWRHLCATNICKFCSIKWCVKECHFTINSSLCFLNINRYTCRSIVFHDNVCRKSNWYGLKINIRTNLKSRYSKTLIQTVELYYTQDKNILQPETMSTESRQRLPVYSVAEDNMQEISRSKNTSCSSVYDNFKRGNWTYRIPKN